MAKWFDWILGAVFVVGAVLKAADMEAFMVQVRAYNVITDLDLVRGVAWVTLLVETGLAIFLLLNQRAKGLVYAVTIAILVGFTGLMVYAWQVHGLEDCGCFGAAISLPIWASILKNVVMIGLAAAAWAATGGKSEVVSQNRRLLLGGGSLMAVIVAGVFGAPQPADDGPSMVPAQTAETEPDQTGPAAQEPAAQASAGPFAKYTVEHNGETYNLAEGAYFVPILSATCDHCMATVPELNTINVMPEAPTVVALIGGKPQEYEEFLAFTAPEFAHTRIELLEMFEYLPGSAPPPAFHIIQDGVSTKHWTEHPPDVNELLTATD